MAITIKEAKLTSISSWTLTWHGMTKNRTLGTYCREYKKRTIVRFGNQTKNEFNLPPQEPGHGSLHLLLMHVNLAEQSSLITHSGLQFGGAPIYPSKHWHEGVPPLFRHIDEGPHGFGWHGSRGVSTFSISCIIGWQLRNGSPVWSGPQLHMGLWL